MCALQNSRIGLVGRLACCLVLAGCPKGEPATDEINGPEPRRPVTIRLLVVDDPPMASQIERQWSGRSELTVIVSETTAAKIEQAENFKFTEDVIVYPAYLLGQLMRNERIRPVPEFVREHEQLAMRNVFPMIRLRETRWGESVYAVSFGSPQFMLIFRRDLFEELGIEVPRTWKDYQQCAAKLADGQSRGEIAGNEDRAWSATLEPLGPGWAGQLLIARAAAYVKHRDSLSTFFDYRSMEPMIAEPPFVRALEELVLAGDLNSPEAISYSPNEVRRRFFAGESAMALTWPTADDADVESHDRPIAGYAELPGSNQVYYFRDGQWQERLEQDGFSVPLLSVAGRLGSVNRRSRQVKAAFHVLAWLSGTQLCVEISPHSRAAACFRFAPRNSESPGEPRTLDSPERWFPVGTDPEEIRGYAQAALRAQDRTDWLIALRIPGRSRYMNALDDAVHQAVAGEKTPQQALSEAAARWQEITQELGIQKQRDAFQRSIGLEL